MESPTWYKVPLVRILSAFATGIGFSIFFPLQTSIIYTVFFLLFLVYVSGNYLVTSYRKRWVHGVLIYLLFIASGMALHTWQDQRNHASYFTHHEGASKLIIRIEKPAQEKARSFRLEGKVLAVTDSLYHTSFAAGKVIIYLPKDSSLALPAYGDVLMVSRHIFKPVPPPQNPGEFDYQRYLAFNQIYFQAYAREKEWVKTDTSMANPLFEKVYAVQRYFKQVLASNIGSANETGVAEALLYGYDDGIDTETVRAYANTGTLHVLAVSGMHVGIIFWILDTMLKWLDKKRNTLLLKQVLILAGLWAYSLLCGLSPSILRATVMFSFIITGKMLNRSVNIYNTLAASAFCLLCYDTNMIANVGFQLSYLAVLGIVFIQPYIYNWYAPSSWLADQIWQITAVSLAAQITTSPISILYFHQFPLCFLLSNLLIIPLTTIILYTGIVLLVCSQITLLALWLGKAMYYMIFYTNGLVKILEQIPYAYVNGLRLSIAESILLYGIAFGLTWYFIYRYRILLQASLMFICLFMFSRFATGIIQQQQKHFIVYQVKGHEAIHFIEGHKSILMMDTGLAADEQKFKFHLQQHIWQSGIDVIQHQQSDTSWKLVDFNGQQILLSGTGALHDSVHCDLLIIRHSFHVSSSPVPAKVVIASSVKPAEARKLEQFFSQRKIPVVYVVNSGAFQLSL